MFPFRTKKRKVWLIIWEFAREDYFRHLGRRRIASILDSRVSSDSVRRYLPLLYSTERDPMIFERYGEMYLQSCRRYRNADWKDVRRDGETMTFGSHPWLSARVVEDFFVDVLDLDTENAYWFESASIRYPREGAAEEITPQRFGCLAARKIDFGWEEKLTYSSISIAPRKLTPSHHD